MPAGITLRDEIVAKRPEAALLLEAIARELKLGASQEQIKGWINEGRH